MPLLATAARSRARPHTDAAAAAATVKLAVVIPTRNRATLAIAAVESLLGQPGCRYDVFVSDNSTDAAEVARLSQYCAAAEGPVTYLKPEQPLRMATHWDWALRTAMERSDATHFTIHYDRRLTKPAHLSLICEAMAARPNELLTFVFDLVTTERGKSVVWHSPWDGRMYTVPTSRVLEMTAQGRIMEMGQSFPVLSNCAVPRAVLQAIVQRFGSICDSVAPDSSFTYRFCETHDRYVHLDRTVGIAYAYDRSTGMGFVQNTGRDFADFMQWWGDRPWLDAAPIPGLNIGQNVLFHEYELVRRATAHPGFKPIDFKGYLHELGLSLLFLQDPVREAELREVLVRHGWDQRQLAERTDSPRRATRMREGWPWLRTLLRDLWDTSVPRLRHKLRMTRMQTTLWLAERWKIPPGDLSRFEFASDREAIAWILAWPRKRTRTNRLLTWFDQPAQSGE